MSLLINLKHVCIYKCAKKYLHDKFSYRLDLYFFPFFLQLAEFLGIYEANFFKSSDEVSLKLISNLPSNLQGIVRLACINASRQ